MENPEMILMYAGLADDDIKAKRGLRDGADITIRFRRHGDDVPLEELLGKTFKIVRTVRDHPTLGIFIEEQ